MFGRAKIAALAAEFMGGATLTLIYLTVSKSPVGIAWFIAVSVGLAAALVYLKLGAVSGAHSNPAITLGLWTVRKITTSRALVYIASQLLGAIAAMALFQYLTKQPLTKIAESDFDWRIFVAEVVGTFILTAGFASAMYQNYEGGKRAATIGISLTLAIMVASIAGNGLVNPAIALGAKSINMAYFAGPALGALLGMNLYAMLFAPAGSLTRGVTSRRAAVTTTTVSRKATTRKRR